MQTIDAHIHIFPPEIKKNRKKISRRDQPFGIIYGNEKSSIAGIEELERYMEEEGIDKVIACGFSFKDRGLLKATNDYIIELSRQNNKIIPFTSVFLGERDSGASEAERCIQSGARGIGEISFYGQGFGKKERQKLEDLAKLLTKVKIVTMIHVNEQLGHSYTGKTIMDLGEVVEFVKNNKDLPLVLSHLGGGLCFYEFMPEIKKALAGVYYDIAATPFLYTEGVYRFIDLFLVNRVIFGSDYPLLRYSRYRAGLNLLRGDAQKKVLGENTMRLLGNG